MGVNFEPKKGRDPIYNTRVLLEEVLQRLAQLAMDDKKLGAALAELKAELAPQTWADFTDARERVQRRASKRA